MKCSETAVTITVVGTKGTPPYQYSIDGNTFQPGATFAKGVGNYTITIKDANGCMATAAVSVTQVPTDVTVSASAPQMKCGETSVTITAVGTKGTPPYQYSIDGTTFQPTGTFAKGVGNYTITVKDANGCTSTTSVIVTQVPNDITVIASAPKLKCGETTVTITAVANKGTAPYQYSIDGTTFQTGNTFTKGPGNYKITAKDANGCSVEFPLSILAVPADLSLSASAPPIACGQTTSTITAIAAKGTSPYEYSFDGGLTFQPAATASKTVGTYKIIVRDANACTAETNVTLTNFISDLDATASVVDVKCGRTNGSISTNATGGSGTYTYSLNGGSFQANKNFSNLAAGNYTIAVKDGNGCIKIINATIKTTDSDLAISTAAPDVKCGENSVIITATATGGSQPLQFSIDGGAYQNGNTFTRGPGIYKISVQDALGCIVESTITVKTVPTDVTVNATAPDLKCDEATTTITATGSKGTGAYQYSIDGGAYQSGNTFVKGPGTYSISVKDINGCTSGTSVKVSRIISDVAVSAVAPDVKCNETSTTITATASKGTAPYQYAIDNGIFQTGNTFSKGPGNYKITAKDNNGCTVDINVTVKTFLSDLDGSITTTNTQCGASVGKIIATPLKGAAPYSYQLNNGSFQNSYEFNTLAAGTYTVVIKDANGCTKELGAIIKNDQSDLSLTATSPDLKCGESTATITATASKGTGPYQYAIDGGTYQAGNTFAKPSGTYKISAKDANNCIVDFTIIVKAELCCTVELAVNAPDVACGQTTTTITATATKGKEPYQYAIDGGTYQATNTFTKGAGTYKVTVKDANGCTMDKNITVNSVVSDLDATAVAPDIKCGETNGSITVTALKGKSPYTYSLDGGAFQNSNVFSNRPAGSYKITVKDAGGCTKDIDVTIKQIASNITLTATAPDLKCGETTVNITATASNGTEPYLYAIDGGTYQAGNTFAKPAGTYKISTKDANGCIVDFTIIVKAELCCTVELAVNAPDVACGQTTTTITATATKGKEPYQYAIDGGTYQAGNTFAKPAGTYKISVKDANGCVVDKDITVNSVVSDLDATAVAPDIKCGETNGSITVNALKGKSPYTYSLDGGAFQNSNIFSNLPAGSYKITVKDAGGCTKDIDVTIKQIASNITLTATAPDLKCGETTVNITATASNGTEPYLYAIDGGTYQAGNTFAKPAGTYKISAKDANGCIVDFTITVKAELCCTVELAVNAPDVACGQTTTTITATATKGKEPYQYAIDGGTYQATNTFTKPAGTYRISAKDANGCIVDKDITVNSVISDLDATASAPDIKCGETNGSITVTALKGQSPYTYSLDGGAFQNSNVFSNRPAGSYKITVKDANGCTKDINVTIKQIASNITVTATGPDIKCGVTTTTITANGALGTEPYQYAIDGGTYQTGNTFTRGVGNYKISAKDANGCIADINITVKAEPCCTLELTITAPDVKCGETTTTITATADKGTPPYQFAINGGTFQFGNTFTKGPGNYKISTKDASGCIIDKNITVSAGPSDLDATASAPDIKCGETNGSITVTALKGKSPYTYSLDGAAFQNSNVFANLPARSYKITVKDAGGCTKDIDVAIKQIASTITLTATAPDLKCGETTVNITATASNGTEPYLYAIDGGTYQAANTFTKPAGTYKISAKDANGCIVDFTITVKPNAADLTATVSTLESTCNGSNGAITVNASKGTLPYSYSLDGGPAQASSSFMLLKAGNYKVTVKDAGGCSIDLNAQVKDICCVMELALTAPDIPCGQTTTVITADATKGVPPYQFSIDGGPVQASNTFTRAAGTYKISVKDATGCLVEKSITLKALVSDLDATATAPDIKCGQANGTITVTATKGTAPYTYSLNNGVFQANNVFTNLGAGVYKLLVKDANGCTKQVDVTIKQSGTNLGASSTSPVIPCNSSSGVLTVLVAGGIPPYSFSLNGGTPQSSNIFTGLKAGNYKITVADVTGCSVDTYTDITEKCCTSELTASAPDVLCGQNTTTITATATKGKSPYEYAIDGGAFQSSNIFVKPAGTYKISAKDANGCIVDYSITVKSATSDLQAAANAPDISCGASNGVITVSALLGTQPYSYSLNKGTYQSSNVFSNLKAGKYDVTVQDAKGCTYALSITIRENCCTTELLLNAPDIACGQTTATITATATKGLAPYQYSINGGSFLPGNTFIKGPGLYTISVKDASGCITSKDILVKTIVSDLSATATAPDITCGDTKGSITVLASKGQQPYTFSLNNGAFQSSNIFSNLTAGSYTLTVKDAAGCQVSLNAQLKLTSVPNLTIVDPSEVCAPATVDLTSNAVTAGSEPGLNYTYWLDAGATQAMTDPKMIGRSGQYFIKATKTVGCTVTKPVKVTVNAIPSIKMKAPEAICSGLTANIEITGEGSAPWSFQYSDGSQTYFVNNINTQQYTLRVTPVQTTTYTIITVNDRFCSNKNPQNNRVTIKVSDPIPGTRLPEVLVSANKPTILKGRNLQGYTYKWEPPVGLNTYSSPTPTFEFNQQVDYRINMTSSAGCITTDSLLVKIVNASNPSAAADFFLPNAFSPNGDGRNDLFFPFAVNIRELKYFRIFNRWGELVFETKSFGDGWNGTYKGQKQSPDAYLWTVEGISEEGKTINKYGNVLLMR
jgi:gliding motility-associated-like protein